MYFLLTPLKEAQSELLARTQLTLWDVLIAFFGGSSGYCGADSKEGGNAIPSVAIVTALMPPLCTAGYGLLATGTTFSVLHIFFLPSTACSSLFDLVGFRLLKLAAQGLVTESKRRLQSIMITAVVLAVMIPSGYGIRTGASGDLQHQSQCRHYHCAATGRVFVLRKMLNHKKIKSV